MDRPLRGVERQWWVQSLRASTNISLVTGIDAPVDRARFTEAAAWIQRRYPVLAARLEVQDGNPHLVGGITTPIPVAWRERASDTAWRAVAERSVCTGFDPAGPLLRFDVLASAETTEIILAIPHLIGDGISMAQIMTEMLLFLDGRAGEPVAVEDRGAIDQRAPAKYRAGWWRFARHVLHELSESPRDPARDARLLERYRPRTRIEWIPIVFEPEETERLRRVSREKGTTVQGAITAAMAIAVGERAAAGGRPKIGVHSPINLRKLLEPPVVEEIGNYASGTTTWLPCGGELWDVAQRVRADIEGALASGVPFANERLARGSKRTAPRTKPSWLARRLWPDLGVTNLGVVKAPDTALGKRIREMHVLTALPVMEMLVCCTVTVNGRLFCDFHYSPDDIERAEVLALVDASTARLRAAIRGAS
jgi:NRPS condensation-like uncharacterized protein